jgi:hypothetical protein
MAARRDPGGELGAGGEAELTRIFSTWPSAVRWAMTSRAAICLSVRPYATRPANCRSRGVRIRPAGPGLVLALAGYLDRDFSASAQAMLSPVLRSLPGWKASEILLAQGITGAPLVLIVGGAMCWNA